MRYLKPLLSFIIVISVLWYFGKIIFSQWHTIISFPWKITPLQSILLISVAFSVSIGNPLSWHQIIKTLGKNITWKDDFRLWTMSNLARFLPGGIWQYPSRVYLLTQHGLTKKESIYALFLETLLSLILGLVLSLLLLFRQNQGFSISEQIALILGMAICFSSAIILTHKSILAWCIHLVRPIPIIGSRLDDIPTFVISLGSFIKLLIVYLPTIVLPSLCLFLLTSTAAIHLSAFDFLLFIGLYAFSWIIGYISVFAPAGLGVTEAVLVIFLAHYLPLPVSIVIALTFRILLLVSEGIVTLVILLFTRNNKPV